MGTQLVNHFAGSLRGGACPLSPRSSEQEPVRVGLLLFERRRVRLHSPWRAEPARRFALPGGNQCLAHGDDAGRAVSLRRGHRRAGAGHGPRRSGERHAHSGGGVTVHVLRRQGLVASADGRFLYVANIGTADTVSAFAIAPGGSLAPLGTAPSGDNPSILAATPDGRHLYSVNAGAGPGGNSVGVYDISAVGTLTPAGSPVPAGSSPRGAAVTPNGAYLYVSNQSSTNLYAFAIAANGALTPVPGSPFTASTGNFDVAITPDGRHLYVAGVGSEEVFAYDIAANGALTPVAGSPFGTAEDPVGLALTPMAGGSTSAVRARRSRASTSQGTVRWRSYPDRRSRRAWPARTSSPSRSLPIRDHAPRSR